MQSQGAPTLGFGSGAYVVGGTGQFDIAAGSISLGKGLGILSLGIGSMLGTDYSFLAPYISSGATINVTVTGNLDMLGSTIAALGGGDVNVTSTGGMMDLGSANLVSFENQIAQSDELGLGIYTSGGGNVNVIASGNVDIDSSTIATFNGGNVLVESQTGSVNTGAGGELSFPVNFYSPTYSGAEPVERVPESGIVTFTLLNASEIPGAATAPGNITVLTPQGNILANQGSILQESLGGVITGNSIVTLTAGTPGTGGWGSTNPPIYIGNIYLGNAAVIGETVNLEATGVITHPDFSTTIAQINGLVTVSWNADGIQLNTQDIPAFIIETSSNLVDWVTTNPSVSTNLYGGLSFELPLSANPGCGFYRILWQ
jgi:hypothetical protein